MVDKRLLGILVCPQTGGQLRWIESKCELWCVASRLAYPVREGVPVMLVDEARHLTDDELATLKN